MVARGGQGCLSAVTSALNSSVICERGWRISSALNRTTGKGLPHERGDVESRAECQLEPGYRRSPARSQRHTTDSRRPLGWLRMIAVGATGAQGRKSPPRGPALISAASLQCSKSFAMVTATIRLRGSRARRHPGPLKASSGRGEPCALFVRTCCNRLQSPRRWGIRAHRMEEVPCPHPLDKALKACLQKWRGFLLYSELTNGRRRPLPPNSGKKNSGG